ncbi:MAG: hypothetical protein J4G06_11010 [Caldilineaceae bacterium]|nr:hypothetical protein [Caldilineaceae bacterium]
MSRNQEPRCRARGPKILGGRPFRLLPLALVLALVLGSGAVFAVGNLFDDDYRDCPVGTRLRDGQIADLTVARDADDADEVNVAWTATDPATWGLGANTYRTALVLLLDDGGPDPHVQTLVLGKRQAVFKDVRKGAEATVQMAIVVSTPDDDYLISDILEADFLQSLSPPAFRGRVRRGLPSAGLPLPDHLEARRNDDDLYEITQGLFYFIGYSEAFLNYKAVDGLPFVTYPATPRLRIGLRHGGEDNDARADVDFDAYVLRIVDGDGDVVPEADDVATVGSADRASPTVQRSDPDTNYDETVLLMGWTGNANDPARFSNVRVNDGGAIRAALDNGGPAPRGFTPEETIPNDQGLSVARPSSIRQMAANDLHVRYADEFRDLPIDVLASDETYTLSAWAVNEDDEVISPVGELQVHLGDQVRTIDTIRPLSNYLGTNLGVRSVIRTTFTVLLD